MTTPILANHDHTKPIGIIKNENGRILFEFHDDVEISREMLFEIFGNAGIRIAEHQVEGDNLTIKSGEILEFSLDD